VTGASGRIGRTILRHWQSEPPLAELILQTRREGSGLLWDPLLSSLPKTLGELSCLVAFAGVTPAAGSELQGNVALAEATLTAAFDSGIPRVLLTSSSAVYGVPRGGVPLTEADTLRPRNPYGEAKARMEAICDRWRGKGLEVCCLRIGNVAGADVLLLRARCGHSDSGFPRGLICDSLCPWQMLGVIDGQATSYAATSAGCGFCRGRSHAPGCGRAVPGFDQVRERHGHLEADDTVA